MGTPFSLFGGRARPAAAADMKMAVAAQHNFEIAAIFMFCGVQPDMKTYYEHRPRIMKHSHRA